MQALTLGQLAAASTGGGSVLLYSSQLQTQGLVAVESNKGLILESWFNGTNTEVRLVAQALPQLSQLVLVSLLANRA